MCLRRLSRDALFNLHEIALDGNFVHRITTFPDLEIFLYNPQLLSTFKNLVCTCETCLPVIQLLYDTTFNMGDFYLSVLLYRHTEFNESPVIPLAFFVHERKLLATHTSFFTFMKSACPELSISTQLIMVTDNEQAIRRSLNTVIPELRTFLCWNHVLQVCFNMCNVRSRDQVKFFINVYVIHGLDIEFSAG